MAKKEKTEKAEKAPKRERKRKEKPQNPHTFDFRRPVGDPNEVLTVVKAFVENGKMLAPNKGLLSPKAYGDAVRAIKAAEEEGKPGPSMPPLYDPSRRWLAAQTNAACVVSGQKGKAAKEPKDWPVGTWREGDRVETKPLRLCHRQDVRDLIDEGNVAQIGQFNYVIGTVGEKENTPAPMVINGARTGNYLANLIALKELSFEGMDEINSVVGRINNDFEIVTLDDGTKPGVPVVCTPNMIVRDWGYFYRDDKKMTLAQIRRAIADGDTKGMRYQAEFTADKPLVGKSISQAQLWSKVRQQMKLSATKRDGKTALERFEARASRAGGEGGEVDARAWHNLAQVQTRTAPHETYPFGFFSAQTCCVPVAHFDEKGEKLLVRFVLGCHIGAKYAENQWQANDRIGGEEEAPAEKTPKAKKEPKPKAAKPKTPKAPKEKAAKEPKPKAEKPKKAKPKKSKPKQAETEAAPVVDGTQPEEIQDIGETAIESAETVAEEGTSA